MMLLIAMLTPSPLISAYSLPLWSELPVTLLRFPAFCLQHSLVHSLVVVCFFLDCGRGMWLLFCLIFFPSVWASEHCVDVASTGKWPVIALTLWWSWMIAFDRILCRQAGQSVRCAFRVLGGSCVTISYVQFLKARADVSMFPSCCVRCDSLALVRCLFCVSMLTVAWSHLILLLVAKWISGFAKCFVIKLVYNV